MTAMVISIASWPGSFNCRALFFQPGSKNRAQTAGIARSIAALRQRHGVASVLSFDAAFDRVPGLTRLR
ncbi:MAG: hypothetical protein ACKO7G_06415 [Gammaproteobacteria bacterium]